MSESDALTAANKDVGAARPHEPEQEIEHLKAEMRAKPEDYPNLLRINREYAARCEAENDALRAALSAKDQQIAHLHAEKKALTAECHLMRHKVITCGVAASHPNANLAHTGAYIDEWDSPQAQQVRELRRELAEARQQLAALRTERDEANDQSYLLRQRAVGAESALAEALARLALAKRIRRKS